MIKFKRIFALLLGIVLLFLLKNYVSFFKSYLYSQKVDKENYSLIILILSAPSHFDHRKNIRDTWLSHYKDFSIKYLFAIGVEDLKTELHYYISIEGQKYKDILYLSNVKDSYFNVTLKLLHSINFIHNNFHFNYFLKCDDDSYVVVDKVFQELENWNFRNVRREELYWGYFNGKGRVKKVGPWKETRWFLCDYYLPYALGGGYILSYNLVKFIATNAKVLMPYNSEDVSVGVWLAPVRNIRRWHDVRFNTEYRSRGCSNQYIISHKQTLNDMKSLHKTYSKTGRLCLNEEKYFSIYEYNWSVPPSQCCERLKNLK